MAVELDLLSAGRANLPFIQITHQKYVNIYIDLMLIDK